MDQAVSVVESNNNNNINNINNNNINNINNNNNTLIAKYEDDPLWILIKAANLKSPLIQSTVKQDTSTIASFSLNQDGPPHNFAPTPQVQPIESTSCSLSSPTVMPLWSPIITSPSILRFPQCTTSVQNMQPQCHVTEIVDSTVLFPASPFVLNSVATFPPPIVPGSFIASNPSQNPVSYNDAGMITSPLQTHSRVPPRFTGSETNIITGFSLTPRSPEIASGFPSTTPILNMHPQPINPSYNYTCTPVLPYQQQQQSLLSPSFFLPTNVYQSSVNTDSSSLFGSNGQTWSTSWPASDPKPVHYDPSHPLRHNTTLHSTQHPFPPPFSPEPHIHSIELPQVSAPTPLPSSTSSSIPSRSSVPKRRYKKRSPSIKNQQQTNTGAIESDGKLTTNPPTKRIKAEGSMTPSDNDNTSESGVHVCDECGKRFSRAYNLKSHQKIHSADKPYSCQYCPKSFARKQDKIRHERIHTNERPFKCKRCDASFTRQDALSRHELTCKQAESFALGPNGEAAVRSYEKRVKQRAGRRHSVFMANVAAAKGTPAPTDSKSSPGNPVPLLDELNNCSSLNGDIQSSSFPSSDTAQVVSESIGANRQSNSKPESKKSEYQTGHATAADVSLTNISADDPMSYLVDPSSDAEPRQMCDLLPCESLLSPCSNFTSPTICNPNQICQFDLLLAAALETSGMGDMSQTPMLNGLATPNFQPYDSGVLHSACPTSPPNNIPCSIGSPDSGYHCGPLASPLMYSTSYSGTMPSVSGDTCHGIDLILSPLVIRNSRPRQPINEGLDHALPTSPPPILMDFI